MKQSRDQADEDQEEDDDDDDIPLTMATTSGAVVAVAAEGGDVYFLQCSEEVQLPEEEQDDFGNRFPQGSNVVKGNFSFFLTLFNFTF